MADEIITNVKQDLTLPKPGNPMLAYKGNARSVIDLRDLGSSGLKQFGGFIYESDLPELTGQRAVKAFNEMKDNDHTCGTVMYVINTLLRQVPWRVAEASKESFDLDAAEFLDSCMGDMEETWTDTTAEAFNGMISIGFSYHEKVYKRRAGNMPQPHLNSRYNDGRIGWRALASRSQDTIYRWVFDDHGRLLGAEQMSPPRYKVVFLPLDKCLLFRAAVEKGNPQGRSIFRSAWRAYYLKRGVENIEGVGVERDVCGIPVTWIPQELIQDAEAGDEDAKAIVETYKALATNLRRDAQEGIVMPLRYDDKGNKMFDISLLSSAGSRQFDTDKIIRRYDTAIARSVLADFLFLGDGGGASGSWAMHSDKTKLFLQSLTTYLDTFTDIINQKAVEPLMRLNGFRMSAPPRIEHGSLDQVNVVELADTILKLAQAGMPIFPSESTESYVRDIVGLPEVVSETGDENAVQAQPGDPRGHTDELIDPPAAQPLAAQQHAQITGQDVAEGASSAVNQGGQTPWPTNPRA
jgi:hypothetical protein